MPRTLLLALVLLATFATAARAEEVVVLDNGAVLMGSVVREDSKELTLRLAGTSKLALITLDKGQVTRRIPADEVRTPRRTLPEGGEPTAATTPGSTPAVCEVPEMPPVPAEEPSIHAEDFFERLARVAVMAAPSNYLGLAVLGLLLYSVLVAIVAMGTRIAEVESTFPRALALAGILAGFLAANLALPHDLLRADRARWILPAEGVAWIVSATVVLRENFGRAILLFAFVLFSLSVVVFTAGAILVTY